MSEELERLAQRAHELEAERERLRAARTPLTNRQKKEQRTVSRELASEEKRVKALEARLSDAHVAAANQTVGMARFGLQVGPLRGPAQIRFLSWAGFVVALFVSVLLLLIGLIDGRNDVRWVETTCETHQRVDSDGDGYTVTIPAIRPNWRNESGCGERCWVMEPEGSARTILCQAPQSAQVTRWEQLSGATRAASAMLLWLAILFLATRIRLHYD